MTRAELKYYTSLTLKKNRIEEAKFVIEGIKLIGEAISSDYYCEAIFYTNAVSEKEEEFVESLRKKVLRIEEIRREDLCRLADAKTPQEVIAVFYNDEKERELKGDLIVALENINDPGNLGTILRSSDWFGVSTILLSDNCAEIYNPKVIRASAGSVFHLDIFESEDFYQQLAELKNKNYKICCADLVGENIYDFTKQSKLVLVMANEANGPTDELLSLCDLKITIPKKGNAESLNVAT
ncbi:MAG: RNA methyltransferase, partial [Ignavibacteria bacterium]|nr:RNA methyltransferase [Ignavibacteria bacterium]